MTTIVCYPNNTFSFRDEHGIADHDSQLKKYSSDELMRLFRINVHRSGNPNRPQIVFSGGYRLVLWANGPEMTEQIIKRREYNKQYKAKWRQEQKEHTLKTIE